MQHLRNRIAQSNMKRLIFSIICVFLTCSFIEYGNESSKILWNQDYKLKWNDFQGSPDSLRTDSEESVTKTRIEVTTKISKNKIEFEVPCYFEKNKSWTVDDSSRLLLNHEQLHFDISEIYARVLRQKLLKIKYSSSKEIELEVKELYHEVFSASVNFQNKYDKETNHSKNKDKQLMWNERVKDILKSTYDYRTVLIVINK